MSRTVRLAGRWAVAVAAAFLLTGCMKIDMDLRISSDNQASGTATFAMDKKILQLSGQSIDEILREADVKPPPGSGEVSTEKYEDDDFIGQTITFEGMPLSKLNGSGQAGDLTIVRQGDEFHVSGVFDLTFPDQGTSGDAQIDDIVNQAMGSADIRVRLTFPGEVISANGDVDGNSVTWRPQMGESTDIRAVASAVSTSPSPMLWIGIALALLVIVGAVLVVRSRRETPAPVGEPGDGAVTGVEAAPGVATTQEMRPDEPTLPAPPAATSRDDV